MANTEIPGRVRWWMAGLLLGPITFVMSLDRTAIVIAAPTIQSEYHFTLVQMSFLLTSFSWTYALLQVPSGWLAERYGPRRMLYWANFLWSVLTAAIPLAGNFTGFVTLRAMLGVGQSADWPSSIVAIRRSDINFFFLKTACGTRTIWVAARLTDTYTEPDCAPARSAPPL